jgi:hypothetical protein
MRDLLWGGRRGWRRPAELLGDLHEVGQDGLVESDEAAAFGGGELVGQREGRELVQGVLETAQIGLELACPGRAGRIRPRRVGEDLERRAQQLLAVCLVSHDKGLDEPQRLARRQAMTVDGGKTGGLLRPGKNRQRVGERGADEASGKALLGVGREAAAQGKAPLHPCRLSRKEPGHLGGRLVVLVDERADHPGLVERCRRPGRSVGR